MVAAQEEKTNGAAGLSMQCPRHKDYTQPQGHASPTMHTLARLHALHLVPVYSCLH